MPQLGDCNLHCVQLVRGGLPPLVQLVRLLLWAWAQGQQPGYPGVTRARVGAEIAAILVHSAGVPGARGLAGAEAVVSSLFLWLLSALGSVSCLLFFCPDLPVTFSLQDNGLHQA